MRLKPRRRTDASYVLPIDLAVPLYASQLPRTQEPLIAIASAMRDASQEAASDNWEAAVGILETGIREARRLQAALDRMRPPLAALAMHLALSEGLELEKAALIGMRAACEQRDPDAFLLCQGVFGEGIEALGRHTDLLNAWNEAFVPVPDRAADV